jgi:hypothetical protein
MFGLTCLQKPRTCFYIPWDMINLHICSYYFVSRRLKKFEGNEGQKCSSGCQVMQYVVSIYVANFTGQALTHSHRHLLIFHLTYYCLLSDSRSFFLEPLQELETHLHHSSLIILYHLVLKHLDREAGLHLVVKSRKCGALPPSLWVSWYGALAQDKFYVHFLMLLLLHRDILCFMLLLVTCFVHVYAAVLQLLTQ